MDEPKSLDSLFKEKLFRIPDYQRGYAWRHEQLKDFWDDLVNLAEGRSHHPVYSSGDLAAFHKSSISLGLRSPSAVIQGVRDRLRRDSDSGGEREIGTGCDIEKHIIGKPRPVALNSEPLRTRMTTAINSMHCFNASRLIPAAFAKAPCYD